jgi:hypothetical protein
MPGHRLGDDEKRAINHLNSLEFVKHRSVRELFDERRRTCFGEDA